MQPSKSKCVDYFATFQFEQVPSAAISGPAPSGGHGFGNDGKPHQNRRDEV